MGVEEFLILAVQWQQLWDNYHDLPVAARIRKAYNSSQRADRPADDPRSGCAGAFAGQRTPVDTEPAASEAWCAMLPPPERAVGAKPGLLERLGMLNPLEHPRELGEACMLEHEHEEGEAALEEEEERLEAEAEEEVKAERRRAAAAAKEAASAPPGSRATPATPASAIAGDGAAASGSLARNGGSSAAEAQDGGTIVRRIRIRPAGREESPREQPGAAVVARGATESAGRSGKQRVGLSTAGKTAVAPGPRRPRVRQSYGPARELMPRPRRGGVGKTVVYTIDDSDDGVSEGCVSGDDSESEEADESGDSDIEGDGAVGRRSSQVHKSAAKDDLAEPSAESDEEPDDESSSEVEEDEDEGDDEPSFEVAPPKMSQAASGQQRVGVRAPPLARFRGAGRGELSSESESGKTASYDDTQGDTACSSGAPGAPWADFPHRNLRRHSTG